MEYNILKKPATKGRLDETKLSKAVSALVQEAYKSGSLRTIRFPLGAKATSVCKSCVSKKTVATKKARTAKRVS